MEKERRAKTLLLSTLIVVVATLSIAFASLSRTLSINGIGKMDTASWSVYFDKLEGPNVVRGAKQVSSPSISADKGTVQDINVKLSNPKDEISYTVDIVNDGTIDAEKTMIKDIELTDVQKKVFEFKVTYTDTGEVLKDGDLLPKKTIKNITINIKFKDDITEFDLPTESQTINLSYQITYTQYDGGNIDAPIIPDDGDITTGKAVLAKGISLEELFGMDDPTTAPFFNGNVGRDKIESLSFINNINVPVEAQSTIWDASEAKDESIIGWYQPSNTEGLYDVYIGSDANIYAPSDSTVLFGFFTELKEINFNNFNTTEVNNMSGMFTFCFSLKNIDLSNFNTSKVTNMASMFNSCLTLESLDLSSFDTSKVTDMSYMFFGDDGEGMLIESINLSGWNTENVETMEMMFAGCGKLTNLDLSSFDTTNVTNMNLMFSSCLTLESLDLSSFNTENVTDMSNMFDSCSSLTNLDVSSFNTSNVTNMEWMFNDCSSLTSLDLSSFDTSNVTNMNRMFDNCSSLTILDLRNADFLKVSSYQWVFENVDTSIKIIVKDETQRMWLTSKFTNLTNVVLASEL